MIFCKDCCNICFGNIAVNAFDISAEEILSGMSAILLGTYYGHQHSALYTNLDTKVGNYFHYKHSSLQAFLKYDVVKRQWCFANYDSQLSANEGGYNLIRKGTKREDIEEIPRGNNKPYFYPHTNTTSWFQVTAVWRGGNCCNEGNFGELVVQIPKSICHPNIYIVSLGDTVFFDGTSTTYPYIDMYGDSRRYPKMYKVTGMSKINQLISKFPKLLTHIQNWGSCDYEELVDTGWMSYVCEGSGNDYEEDFLTQIDNSEEVSPSYILSLFS